MENFDLFFKDKVNDFRKFLVTSAYWCGFSVGFGAAYQSAEVEVGSDKIKFSLIPDDVENSYTPGFSALILHWYSWYGTVRLSIDFEDRISAYLKSFSMTRLQEMNRKYRVNEFIVYNRDDRYLNEIQNHVSLVETIELMSAEFLAGIKINNSFRPCFTCQELRFVELTADKWLCENCKSSYSLGERVSTLTSDTKQQKSEREKMTDRLRFKILERDNFRCKACGCSPRIDRNVVLEVDHIIPIALGGKTVEENLQALCKSCNRGKGADSVEQMKFWT